MMKIIMGISTKRCVCRYSGNENLMPHDALTQCTMSVTINASVMKTVFASGTFDSLPVKIADQVVTWAAPDSSPINSR